jgi:hypothetical protein
MNEYQYRTLCGLGEALYKHCALIKRAEEAKIAMSNITKTVGSKVFQRMKCFAKKTYEAKNKFDKYKSITKGNLKGIRNVQGN